MSCFDEGFGRFFKELADNNNKEWFHAHRPTYENKVRKPFLSLLEELIFLVRKDDPQVDISPSNAMFRINRDIRFSKDKTPYKTHVAAAIQRGSRKAPNMAGFYIHLAPNSVWVGGGSHSLDKDGLYQVRKHITQNLSRFDQLIKVEDFVDKFGAVKGDRNKRLPKEFDQALEQQPLVTNKHFFYMAELSPKVMFDDNLPDLIMDYFRAGHPFNDFLQEALAQART